MKKFILFIAVAMKALTVLSSPYHNLLVLTTTFVLGFLSPSFPFSYAVAISKILGLRPLLKKFLI